jgi:hypothetical protein
MITYTELFPLAEVGAALARAMLLEQSIDTTTHQLPKQKIAGVKGISKQNILAVERIEYVTQQGLFVATLAFARSHGAIQQCPTTQAQQRHHTTQGETQARFLAVRLWIGGLIRFRVRQRHRGAIDQTHRTAPSGPIDHRGEMRHPVDTRQRFGAKQCQDARNAAQGNKQAPAAPTTRRGYGLAARRPH